jgi:hypothetical protein
MNLLLKGQCGLQRISTDIIETNLNVSPIKWNGHHQFFEIIPPKKWKLSLKGRIMPPNKWNGNPKS